MASSQLDSSAVIITKEERWVLNQLYKTIDLALNNIERDIISIDDARHKIKNLCYSNEKLNNKIRQYLEAGIKLKKKDISKQTAAVKRWCIHMRILLRRKIIPECKAVYDATKLLDEREARANSRVFNYTKFFNASRNFRAKYQRFKKYLEGSQ
jgi:hypothetical protein